MAVIQTDRYCKILHGQSGERLGDCFLWTTKGGTDPSITNNILCLTCSTKLMATIVILFLMLLADTHTVYTLKVEKEPFRCL